MVQSLAPPDETGVFDEDFYFPLRNLVFSISRFEGEGRRRHSPILTFGVFQCGKVRQVSVSLFITPTLKWGKSM